LRSRQIVPPKWPKSEDWPGNNQVQNQALRTHWAMNCRQCILLGSKFQKYFNNKAIRESVLPRIGHSMDCRFFDQFFGHVGHDDDEKMCHAQHLARKDVHEFLK
jgi:hypothetical protein